MHGSAGPNDHSKTQQVDPEKSMQMSLLSSLGFESSIQQPPFSGEAQALSFHTRCSGEEIRLSSSALAHLCSSNPHGRKT